MQTSYQINLDKAQKGQTEGKRFSKPRTLPYLPQITTLTLTDSSEAGDLVLSILDKQTGLTYSLTVAISGVVEATSLDEIVAAWRANGKFNDLFSVSEDGSLTLAATARHANREYTITATPPGSMSVTVANTQEAGGTGIEPGHWVRRGSNDGEIEALAADTTLSELEGVLVRTDGNHFHELQETLDTVDRLDRGRTLRVLESGSRVWVEVEDAVTPASTPYVRRALTSSSGTVGAMRGSAAGSTQVATITPVADHLHYSIKFGYLGRDYEFSYDPTDGTTTVADAVDGLEDAAAAVVPTGVTASSASGATMTLTAAAGTEFDYVESTAFSLDTEAASASVSLASADVDTIDVSSLCEFETSAGAGELARLYIK